MAGRRLVVGAALAVGGAAALGALAVPPALAGAHAPRPKAPTSLRVVSGARGTYLRWHGRAVTGYAVEQSTDPSFHSGVRTYRTHAPVSTFTPYGLTDGKRYYFRVRGVDAPKTSAASSTSSAMVQTSESPLRVLSYNVLDASFDGEQHPGGRSAPFAKRRAGELWLINRADADVLGIQEGSSCLVHRKGEPCWRQIDSLAAGLKPQYRLDDTDGTTVVDRYTGDYILYAPAMVTPVGTGGHWMIGTRSLQRFAAYQLFRVNQTGARFLFVTVHTDAPMGAKYDAIRGAETKAMLTRAATYAARRGSPPAIYTGDFNTYVHEYRTHDVSGAYMRAAGLLDGIQVAQTLVNAKYDSLNEYYRHPRKGHGSADHVYVSPGVGVRSWREVLHLSHGRFVGTIPSDHNPIVSSVEIPY
jgi:endonuclease/exonuclease/phosphatase family metal-dependent hydrolase